MCQIPLTNATRAHYLLNGGTNATLPLTNATGAQRGGKNLSCGMSWMYVSPRLCPQSCPHVS